MRRAARSISRPSRASSYRRRPPTRTAECIGGTWSRTPRKAASASSTRAASTSTGSRTTSVPSVSPVVVSTPRRSVAGYALVASSRKRPNLVASPKTSGSRPVANGSSVPVWPALRAFSSRFARPRACVDENPGGLSSSRTPSGWGAGMLGARLARARGLRRLEGLVDQAGEADSALDGRIELEMQLGDLAGGEPVRELAAQESGRMRQPTAGLGGFGCRSQGRVIHLGVRLVARELHAGERHQAHARVAHLESDQLGKAALDLLGDAGAASGAHAGGGAPRQATVRATSTTSKTSIWSPTWMSLKFLIDKPHSNPAFTSRTSSLKRLSESSSPVCTTTPARMRRTAAPRRTTPSATMHPATVPTLEILKTLRTSTMPSTVSLRSGASMPPIAAFTSSTAS